MGRFKHKPANHEFELDLAPLLSVMVKLVPVLLLSSAFVQVMVIETDLPQAVQQAVQQNNENPTAAVQLTIDSKEGFKVIVQKGSDQKVEQIPLLKDNNWDLKTLHATLAKVKQQHPEVFKIEFNPAANVPYRDIVKFMDEARKAKNKDLKFPVINKKDNTTFMTDYMFPDVVFTNVMDG